jgi:hypothetical protein
LYKFIEYLIAGKAFCAPHCEKVTELGYPTNLREFLKSCGGGKDAITPDHYNKDMQKMVHNKRK